jgi:hypothetical protein
MKPSRAVVTLLLPLVALACSHDPDSADTSDERCNIPDPTRGREVDGALTLGEGEGATFAGLEDGQPMTLIRGPQGGFMVTPVLRVDQGKMGTDGRCVYTELGAEIDGLDPISVEAHLSGLTADATHLTSEAIPFLLAFDPNTLVGKTCVLSATWEDDGINATAQATVVLVQ